MAGRQRLEPELDSAVQRRASHARWLILQAGRLTWNYFERGVSAEFKDDQTPVTVADRQAEELLRGLIAKEFPGDGFLGEEFGEERSESGFRWIIDPIDATKNFVRGIPIYANLVGLEHEGALVAGLCYVPALQLLYHAVAGRGAFRNDEPIKASSVTKLGDAMLTYSSIDWFDKTNTTDFFLDVVRRVSRTRGFGDFYGMLLVAQGSVEAMLEPEISPWDIAALKPIVEEAGGVFTDWHGNDTIYGEGCIVANPAIHRALFDLLRRPSPDPPTGK